MKFRAHVEPPEPMRGLEVPQEVVDALGGGKRPSVTITTFVGRSGLQPATVQSASETTAATVTSFMESLRRCGR